MKKFENHTPTIGTKPANGGVEPPPIILNF
jgi:hypothetical protein